MQDLKSTLAAELKIDPAQVDAAVSLLGEGATPVFIARYRKDRTRGLDEPKLRAIAERFRQHSEMEERRAAVLKAVTGANAMTPELQAKIEQTQSRQELEDIYMPFRSRRRTRSSAAKTKGLEPLSDLIFKQATTEGNVEELVKPFISAEKGVPDMAAALSGARDIIAEQIAEDAESRRIARNLLHAEGKITTKAREGIDLSKGKYAAFAQFSENIFKVPPHKLLAALRGSSEKQVSVVIETPKDKILAELKAKHVKPSEALFKPEVVLAVEESYDRLLGPALDNELRLELKKRADIAAIEVFTRNLRALMLQPPFGAKAVMAIGPAVNAPFKAVVLNGAGKVVAQASAQPEKGEDEKKSAIETLTRLIKENDVKAVVIGNANGSREADAFIRDLLKGAELTDVARLSASEGSASTYGASILAREELPDLDNAGRAIAHLGRRLQDPLLELVKVDPKTLTLGQYQHDVDQALLQQKLEETIQSCVAEVGADANAASESLLRHVPGLTPVIAKALVEARAAKSGFKSRQELREIAGLDQKVFEQCAGVLRIKNGENPLDRTPIHPEMYPTVDAIAAEAQTGARDLLGNGELLAKIDLAKFKTDSMSESALKDILAALATPDHDPRGVFVKPEFNDEVHDIKDLKEGMVLNGVVSNLTAFGAFVDVGVHQDGLVHISAITHKFIREPSDIVTVGQRVKVKVLAIDADKKRISLSMKALEEAPAPRPRRQPTGAIATGPRPPRQDRPSRGPRRAPTTTVSTAGAAARTTPASAAAGTGAAAAPTGPPPAPRYRFANRPQRQERPPRKPDGQPGTGAPGAPGTATAAGPSRDRGTRSMERPHGRDRDRERKPPAPPPGKPDYSKFFVKAKRKDSDKKVVRHDAGASRDEVREVLRAQGPGGTSLGDLLRKAGVVKEE